MSLKVTINLLAILFPFIINIQTFKATCNGKIDQGITWVLQLQVNSLTIQIRLYIYFTNM